MYFYIEIKRVIFIRSEPDPDYFLICRIQALFEGRIRVEPNPQPCLNLLYDPKRSVYVGSTTNPSFYVFPGVHLNTISNLKSRNLKKNICS